METRTEEMLVMGEATVPESFGEVEGGYLAVRDEYGHHLCSVNITPKKSRNGKVELEFRLRKNLLMNSLLTAWRIDDKVGFKGVTFRLGTFAITEHPKVQEISKPYPLRVALAEFGLMEGRWGDDFTLTDRVPWEEDQSYGFRLYIRGDGRSLPMRVEMELPSPPKSWGEPERVSDLVISQDGRTASRTSMVATDKLIERDWVVAPGDPEGEYQIRVYVQEQLVKTFKFRVQRE